MAHAVLPVKITIINKNTGNISNMGSGVLLRALNEDNDLVITCAHCLNKIDEESSIELVINDQYELTCELVDYYVSEDASHEINNIDVGAILIKKINLSQDIYLNFNYNDTENTLNISGYPAILKEDSSIKLLTLHGKYKDESKSSKLYAIELEKKITDTSNSSEKEKIEGLSGSPVYYKHNSKIILIGIVKQIQSNDGFDIPFNRIYILKIEAILEHLRENGIIIYNNGYKNGLLKIKWIKNQSFEKYLQKNILVIGGSGAGKSSFINTFAKNSKNIDSSGDGQTTRMNVEYKFSIYEKEPRIEIEFLNKDNFVEKRVEPIELNLIEFTYKLINGYRYKLKGEIDLALKQNMKKLKLIISEQDTSNFNNRNDKEELRKKIDIFINEWDEINNRNDDKKRIDIIELNKELIEILYEIKCIEKPEAIDKLILSSEEQNELKNILLDCRGFFSYKEFDFLDMKGKKISDLIENRFYEDFSEITILDLIFKNDNNKIKNLYNYIYEIIWESLKFYYDINATKCKFKINKASSCDKLKITMLLRVIDEKSATSLVSKLTVYDSFSNDYVLIMDKIMLNEITFIDTCGLDHVEVGEAPKDILKRVFAEHNDNIKTIFYIKKLDAGKPTELESIIPSVYAVQANAIIYCIFNGIDIFYHKNNNHSSIIRWDEDKIIHSYPRSVRYILSDEGKKDMLTAMVRENIRNGRSEIIYATLSRNLVPFCSNLKNENNIKFLGNNIFYIQQLFKSIVLEEHLGLEIIPEEIVKEIKKDNSILDKELEKLLRKVFELASITDWTCSNLGHGHHKTKKANIDKIKGVAALGYWGTYDDRWNYHFKEAYNYVFSYNHDDGMKLDYVLKLISKSEGVNTQIHLDKIESLFIDFKDIFLGCRKNKDAIFYCESEICKRCDINECECFRKLLLSMYSKKCFKYDINYKPVSVKSEEWLNEICNFVKGFDSIKTELISFFKNEFLKKVQIENSKNLERIIRINPQVRDTYEDFLDKVKSAFLNCRTEEEKQLAKMVFEYFYNGN